MVHAQSLSSVQLFATPWTVAMNAGFSVPGIFQARILEWLPPSSSRGFSWPRNQTQVSCVSCIGSGIPYHWATWEGCPRIAFLKNHFICILLPCYSSLSFLLLSLSVNICFLTSLFREESSVWCKVRKTRLKWMTRYSPPPHHRASVWIHGSGFRHSDVPHVPQSFCFPWSKALKKTPQSHMNHLR